MSDKNVELEKEKKEVKKDGNQMLKMLSARFTIIITVLFTLQIANLLAGYFLFKSSFIITIVLYLLIFGSFAILKDFLDEKNKKTAFLVVKIATIIMIYSGVNNLLLSMGSHFNTEAKARSLFKLSYFINLAMTLGMFALLRGDKTKEILDSIYNNSIIEKFKLGTLDTDTKQGDVILCINQDTGTPEILPRNDRYLHMLILGPTGCGKTSQIIIPMINQDMQNFEAGITVIEPKGDLAEKVYAMAQHYGRKAVYFNPTLPDCPYFNPLFGREDDVIENMATTFKMLNPDSPQFFQDMNEQLIRNALKVLKRMSGNSATLIDLSRLIQNTGGVGRKMVTQFSRLNAETAEIAKENSDIAQWFLNDYLADKSKTYEHCSGVRTQVAKISSNKFLRRVLNPPDGLNDVDFDKHLAEGGVIAICTAQGALRDLGRFLGYFIILNFQSSVFKRPGNEKTRRPHFLYIDEFQTYSNPGFADMLTQGRSYRVASHLATQNRALMAMGGGRDGKNFVELVSTNARNVVLFPGGNAIDAKYYSDQFGEIIEKTTQKGIARQKFNPLYGIKPLNYATETVRVTEELKARFSASDLIYRPSKEITYCIIKNNTIQFPKIGKVEYIDNVLNDKLDSMIDEYNNTIFLRQEEEEQKQQPQETQQSSEIKDILTKEPVIKNSVIQDTVLKTLRKENNFQRPIAPIAPSSVLKDINDFDENSSSKNTVGLTDVSIIEGNKPSAGNEVDMEFGAGFEDDLI